MTRSGKKQALQKKKRDGQYSGRRLYQYNKDGFRF